MICKHWLGWKGLCTSYIYEIPAEMACKNQESYPSYMYMYLVKKCHVHNQYFNFSHFHYFIPHKKNQKFLIDLYDL